MKDFNDFLGLDEAEFMKATQATFKLGIEFVNWGRAGDRYVHPFGTFGRPLGEADLFSYWIRAHRAGTAASLYDYCFPIVARQSVGEGKSVSVRVELGGRRIIKQTHKEFANTA